MDASPTGTQKVPRRAVHRPPQTRSSRDGGHPPGTCRALRRGLATGFGPWIVCAHVQGCGLSAESVAAKLITEDLAVLPLGPFWQKKPPRFTQGNQDYFFCAMWTKWYGNDSSVSSSHSTQRFQVENSKEINRAKGGRLLYELWQNQIYILN